MFRSRGNAKRQGTSARRARGTVLTVALSTKNRSSILRGALESFCRLQAPAAGWKLIVVDNGSTDETSQVIASFENRLPLEGIREPRPGKSAALNVAIGHTEGDLTILTDDDVFPRQDWLVQMRKAADEHPEF